MPLVFAAVLGLAFIITEVYKRFPNLKGGGIPTSILFLRGILNFKWIENVFGIFALSLSSFFIGVPLGNEGPSVQMGTAVGRATVRLFAKKHRAWDRYSMTGGACAGFSVATGSPISGIMFAIEEAHQRISPMIVIVSTVSVIFANLTSALLSPIFNVSTSLFENSELYVLSIKEIWLPITVGAAIGVFAVIFLKYYQVINHLFNRLLKNFPVQYKIFMVFILTVIAGLVSESFISTGHHLMLSLFEGNLSIVMLLLILVVRSTLTLSANTNGMTGGMFVPMLALGALASAALGEAMISFFGIDSRYFSLILTFGIVAAVASIMKMPITAVVFAVEALGCHENIIYVIIVCAISYVITEVFDVKSINDATVDRRIEALIKKQVPTQVDTFVTVKKGSFAIGKQIRDIFWPANLFVLSVIHNKEDAVDKHRSKTILEGDTLHIRYSAFNAEDTVNELYAIVGIQD